VGFDARSYVLFAGCFAAVGAFGWEGGVADWAFVFFAEESCWRWRWRWRWMWEGGVDVEHGAVAGRGLDGVGGGVGTVA